MKQILLCLMMYVSCAQAVLIRIGLEDFARFRTMEAPEQWQQLGLLFHTLFSNGCNITTRDGFPLHQVELDPEDEHELKEQRRAQKLEVQENTKRALLASRRRDNHLPKKDKWVCQQPRYNKKNH